MRRSHRLRDSPKPDRDVDEPSPELKQAPTTTVKRTLRQRLALITNFLAIRSSEKEKEPGDAEDGAVSSYDEPAAMGPRRDNATAADPSATWPRCAEAQEDPIKDLLSFSDGPREPHPSDFVSGDGLVSDEAYKTAMQAYEEARSSYALKKIQAYDALRQQVTQRDAALGFEFACTANATELEIKANKVLQELKKKDVELFYKKAGVKVGYHGQKHARFFGDHFLSNVDIIKETQLFALCRAMPKGAHLHIHFNANLLPNFLLDIAKKMDRMFIWSNMSLVEEGALEECRLQFSIMSEATVGTRGRGDLFDREYGDQRVMRFQDFIPAFGARFGDIVDVDTWLQNKLVFQEEEAHHMLQTSEG